jgi:hypothetical protein
MESGVPEKQSKFDGGGGTWWNQLCLRGTAGVIHAVSHFESEIPEELPWPN